MGRKVRVRWIGIALVLLAVLGAACTRAPAANEADGVLQVMVSIVPQVYFVERIGGEHVSATAMVVPGANPATYEPKPEQLKALSRSAAYFSIGVPFEGAWLDKIASANPEMAMIDTTAGIERIPIEAHEDDDHAAGAPDPHVWLSPRLVKVQAQTIYKALVELAPEHTEAFQANLGAFLDDIDALEAEIQEALSGIKIHKFMVFHPSWGYFARDFGLEQIAIEIGGQEPSAQELAGLVEEARAEGIRVILAQPEFSTSDAETIAREIGGEVLLISPLAADWMENLRQVAGAFAQVLG
jgi:zinc transport system substrate-binding protein